MRKSQARRPVKCVVWNETLSIYYAPLDLKDKHAQVKVFCSIIRESCSPVYCAHAACTISRSCDVARILIGLNLL